MSAGRFAVADLGSNTVHLLAAKSDGQELSALHEESVRLRLGADVARTGSITDSNVEGTLKAVERFLHELEPLDVDELHLLGTHPVRRAANAGELTKAIVSKTGVQLHTLSPEDEAYLGYTGTTIDYPDLRPTLVVDVGGGSTQLSTIDKKGGFEFVCSAPVGTVNLPVKYLQHDPPSPEEASALQIAVDEALLPLSHAIRPSHTDLERGVLIGGLARRLRRASRLSARAPVSLSRLEHIQTAVMTVGAVSLETLGAARRDDVGMLRAGATILVSLMRNSRLGSFALSHNGLREGAILLLARGEDLPGRP